MTDFRKVAISEVPNTPNPTRAKHELDEMLGATAFGLNHYVADPGEQIPWGRHRHPDHEEAFYVLSGELSVETPEGEFTVESDEAFFVPKNAWNRAVAVGEKPCHLLAFGAPKDTDEAVIEDKCPECGEFTRWEYESREDTEGYVLYCSECGAETNRFSG
jgi:quercetin dioxygenase-like cupin family protein